MQRSATKFVQIFTLLIGFSFFSEVLPQAFTATEPEQVLFVTAQPKTDTGQLSLFTVKNGNWETEIADLPVKIGRTGLVASKEKREGDGHTPMGMYPIQRIFGREQLKLNQIAYTKLKPSHHWVHSQSSDKYNQFLPKKGNGAVKLLDQRIYDLFLVVEYNTNPAVPGLGSMIFLHGWEENKATSGCIGLRKDDLLKLVQLLDGQKNPMLVIQEI